MLDDNFNTKLIDFGDAKCLDEEEDEEQSEGELTSDMEDEIGDDDDMEFGPDEEFKENERENPSKSNSYYNTVRERCDTFVGTVNYLSPEVIKTERHTLAIDIWALGLMFFKMLTGRVAFPGTSQVQVFEAIKRR